MEKQPALVPKTSHNIAALTGLIFLPNKYQTSKDIPTEYQDISIIIGETNGAGKESKLGAAMMIKALEEGEELSIADRTVQLLTVNDFSKLLSRDNIIALLVFSILFGIASYNKNLSLLLYNNLEN